MDFSRRQGKLFSTALNYLYGLFYFGGKYFCHSRENGNLGFVLKRKNYDIKWGWIPIFMGMTRKRFFVMYLI